MYLGRCRAVHRSGGLFLRGVLLFFCSCSCSLFCSCFWRPLIDRAFAAAAAQPHGWLLAPFRGDLCFFLFGIKKLRRAKNEEMFPPHCVAGRRLTLNAGHFSFSFLFFAACESREMIAFAELARRLDLLSGFGPRALYYCIPFVLW